MENYYVTHAMRIQREVQMGIPHYKRFVLEAYGPDLAESIVKGNHGMVFGFFASADTLHRW